MRSLKYRYKKQIYKRNTDWYDKDLDNDSIVPLIKIVGFILFIVYLLSLK